MIHSLLAWRPFLDPLQLHAWWWAFLIPLAFGIAFTYKAIRVPTLEGYFLAVLKMTAQIILGMILLGIASFLFIEIIVPRLVPMGR